MEGMYSEGMLKAKVRRDAAEQPIQPKLLRMFYSVYVLYLVSTYCYAETENGWEERERITRSLCLIYSSTLVHTIWFGIYLRNKNLLVPLSRSFVFILGRVVLER